MIEDEKKRHKRAQHDGSIQSVLNAGNNANIEINLSVKIFL